ncbi:bacterioferritin [Xanthomonas citri pv. malvacearum]|nr:(2Fe-2S)-binding protein [Xanthomonas citri]AOL18302.1 bacterioferritin [Xanthomonas citri pv. malvacearum]
MRCNQRRSFPDRQHPTDTVYVCICNGVTDHQIREAAENGCVSLAELTMRTGCGSNCGSCLEMAGDLLSQAHANRALPLPLLGLASAA